MQQTWGLALPGRQQAPERDGVKWQPTHVVINLGTNDIAQGIPEKEDFVKAYRGLIADVRRDAPRAPIYCVFGPMINVKKHGAILDWLREIAADDARIHVVRLRNEHGMQGVGASWHPNVRSQQSMANQLVQAMGLEQE